MWLLISAKRPSSEVTEMHGDVRPRYYCSKPPIVYITVPNSHGRYSSSHCSRLRFFPLPNNGLILVETHPLNFFSYNFFEQNPSIPLLDHQIRRIR